MTFEAKLKLFKAREAADSGINGFVLSFPLSPAPRALQVFWVDDPGVALRSTPGSTLSPATAGWLDEMATDSCQAIASVN